MQTQGMANIASETFNLRGGDLINPCRPLRVATLARKQTLDKQELGTDGIYKYIYICVYVYIYVKAYIYMYIYVITHT